MEDFEARIQLLEKEKHDLALAVDKKILEIRWENELAIRKLKEEAFPKGDAEAHHDDHEEQNAKKEEWKELWKGLRKKIFEGAGWAIVVAVAGAVGLAFKLWVKS